MTTALSPEEAYDLFEAPVPFRVDPRVDPGVDGATEFVDEETGEIFTIPNGTDECLALARAFFEAKAQVKAWEQRVSVAQAALLERQTEKRVVYDDRAVSFRQNITRRFEPDAFRFYAEDARLAPGQLFDLVLAAKDFNVDAISDKHLAAMVEKCRSEKLGRPWLAVDLVRKFAPGGSQ